MIRTSLNTIPTAVQHLPETPSLAEANPVRTIRVNLIPPPAIPARILPTRANPPQVKADLHKIKQARLPLRTGQVIPPTNIAILLPIRPDQCKEELTPLNLIQKTLHPAFLPHKQRVKVAQLLEEMPLKQPIRALLTD